MLAKTLPLLMLGACASTAQLPTANQPQLAQLAQSYAQELQAVGITRVISPGNGAMVRLETGYGPVYASPPH
jgi:outer membrane biogenesis lipoprotein LolB